MKLRFLMSAVAVTLLLASTASADIVHDESVDGDLNGNFTTPTVVNYLPGANTIIGGVGENGNTGATDGSDADYFTFVIEAGETLTSINVDSRSGAGVSFLGYAEGSSFTGQSNGDIDGFVLFSNTSGEVLDDLTGSLTPLGPGSYAFWVQETASVTVDYSFTFNVANSVPEPGSLLLGAVAGCGLLVRRRR